MLWSSAYTLDRVSIWWCVEKNWVKEGRQSNNYMESEHCSWESSLSQRRGRPSEEVIYFSSGDGNWRAVGRTPVELLTGNVPSRGYCLSLLPLSPTPTHFPSPTFLIFARELPLSLWEKEEEERKKGVAAQSSCHFCLTHSQTLFIPHSCGLQSSVRL